MRVVIDTNIWVSALVFGGKPRQVFKNIAKSRVKSVISDEILTEIRRVLNQKFPDFIPQLEKLLVELRPDLARVEPGAMKIDISRDPKDNMILEAAMAGDADYIISGDNDLLSLQRFGDIQIVSPADFLGQLS